MADDLLGARTHERGTPAASDAIAFTGGIGISIGVLLLTVHFFAYGHGRPPGVALFLLLIVAGYVALLTLPMETHPAAITVIAAGVPGALGWAILPHAHRFADIRPFLVLVIAGYAACWLAPRTRGRTIFVAIALIVLWLWILGEVAGTDAYSAAPVPSPPAHTTFSLSALTQRARVTIGDLDPSSPLYPLAQECDFGNGGACDTLHSEATPGSDFYAYADTCGGTQIVGSGGQCAELEGSGVGNTTPFPSFADGGLVPGESGLSTSTHDKSLELGLVSVVFGIVYVGALWAFDRRRWHGLGTALVIPGLLALFTGTELLGNAAHHAWFGGLLTFVGGIAFALIGDLGNRRFTTWVGGVIAALGAYTVAADVANLANSFPSGDRQLVRPALVTLGFGLAMVGLAMLIAMLRTRMAGPASPLRPAAPPGSPPGAPLIAPSAISVAPLPPWETPPSAPPGAPI